MTPYEIFHERQMALADDELKEMHGDHTPYSISRWRAELKVGATELCYIDWRADRIWSAARKNK